MRITDAVATLIGPWLARQRWMAHGSDGPPTVEVEHSEVLVPPEGDAPGVLWFLVHAGPGPVYQALVGVRPDAIDLGDRDVLGFVDADDGKHFAYDALVDPEAARRFAAIVGVPGVAEMMVRPVGAEQSNSSVVIGEKVIMKVYRRVHPGPNPDVEVGTALDRVGFNHLPSPVAVWRRGDYDLAVAQEYLAGGTEGWALALASLRDLYGGAEPDPAEAGGNMGSEARRIGNMTARLHLALSEAFGLHAGSAEGWARAIEERAASLSLGPQVERRVGALAARVRRLAETGALGPCIRVHGDYHLGQVMRTDSGWYVLDFEGEPARPLAERRLPWPPAKDVSGMLRSFHYAAAVALADRDDADQEGLAGRARAWEQHTREAFLEGYNRVEGIGSLLPGGDPEGRATRELTTFFEVDKALYEVAYERAHRPDWEQIPRDAIDRLLAG
jgi:maltokinase